MFEIKPIHHYQKSMSYKAGTWKMDVNDFLEMIETKAVPNLISKYATHELHIIIHHYYLTNSLTLKLLYLNVAWEVFCKDRDIIKWNNKNRYITYEIAKKD